MKCNVCGEEVQFPLSTCPKEAREHCENCHMYNCIGLKRKTESKEVKEENIPVKTSRKKINIPPYWKGFLEAMGIMGVLFLVLRILEGVTGGGK